MIDDLDFLSTSVMTGLEMLMGFWFFTGFLQKKGKILSGMLFAVFGTVVLEILHLQSIWASLVFIIFLVAVGKLFYGVDVGSAILYAVVTVEMLALCFGLCNSCSYLLFPVVFEKNPQIVGMLFAWGGNIFALGLAFFCYRMIRKCCACFEAVGKKYIFLILMPVLLIFLASEYINKTVYGNTITIEQDRLTAGVNPYQMLLMQALGIMSLFCIMFFYKKLAESVRQERETALLELQAHAMAQYVEEAKLRYERTKSFRHDIKNHITVVKELLQNSKIEAALQYVDGMEDLSADLSFPVSTNHPVLDILLGNKLGIAKENQIEVRCSLVVPYPCGISDIDFCIIFGNVLDNAVAACHHLGREKQKYIHISGKVQGDFLFMEIENSYSGSGMIHSGTGLANIRMAVEKYEGTMEIQTKGENFTLSILLIIPQQSESISRQMGEMTPKQ